MVSEVITILNDVMLDRQDRYRTKNFSCNSILYYDIRKSNIKSNQCMRFSCGKCRNKAIKYKLNEVVCSSFDNNLKIHFCITLEGKDFRRFIDPDYSFKYIYIKWNNFRNAYKRKFKKKLSYVAFFRSQESGYAHLHILLDKYIPSNWIESILRKLRLGWARIKYVDVQRIKNYLSKYWYKEHEWFIPKGKKHFSTSRDISLKDYSINISSDNFFKLNSEYYFDSGVSINDFYNQIEDHSIKYEVFGLDLETSLGYSIPIVYFLKVYYENIRR